MFHIRQKMFHVSFLHDYETFFKLAFKTYFFKPLTLNRL